MVHEREREIVESIIMCVFVYVLLNDETVSGNLCRGGPNNIFDENVERMENYS